MFRFLPIHLFFLHTMNKDDNESLVTRTITLLGGKQNAMKLLEEYCAETDRLWERDTQTIGRILRSHLFVEHHLNEYLQVNNPGLGLVEDARLTFAQKVNLLGKADTYLAHYIRGIKHLNTIRNRIAHNLSADLTEADTAVFFATPPFKAIIIELSKPGMPSKEPVVILEQFAQFAASALSKPSAFALAYSQALTDSSSNSQNSS